MTGAAAAPLHIARRRSLLRAIAYFVQRWVLRRPFLLARATSLGLVFRVKTQDVVGRHIYKYHAHEPALSDWLVRNAGCRDGDVFLDIGANIGWYSLLLSRIARPGSRIFAFEPDALNSRLLRENVALNGADAVEVVVAAVAESSGRSKLYRYSDNNLGRHSMLASSGRDAVEIDTVGLDDFWQQRGLADATVRVLKIDVEGYEYFALNSGKAVLRRTALVVSEYSPDVMVEHGLRPAALLDLLGDAGFTPWRLSGGTLAAVHRDELLALHGVVELIWRRSPQGSA